MVASLLLLEAMGLPGLEAQSDKRVRSDTDARRESPAAHRGMRRQVDGEVRAAPPRRERLE